MRLHSKLRIDDALDVGLGDGAVDVGDDQARALAEEEDRKGNLDVQGTDHKYSLVNSGLMKENKL